MPSKLVIFCYDFAWASSLMRVLQTLGYNIIMPTSNGYILFILNPNLVKFVSNVKSQMYTFIFYFFLESSIYILSNETNFTQKLIME